MVSRAHESEAEVMKSERNLGRVGEQNSTGNTRQHFPFTAIISGVLTSINGEDKHNQCLKREIGTSPRAHEGDIYPESIWR